MFPKRSTTYTDNGSKLSTATDAAGNTVQYEYNSDGLQTAVTDAKGNTTEYTYDDEKRMTEVALGDSSVEYAYTQYYNELYTITRATDTAQTVYEMWYNYMGLTSVIKVGTGILARYTYNDRNLMPE